MAIRIASSAAAATTGVGTRIEPSCYFSRTIPDADEACADDPGVDAAQMELPADRRVDELHRIHPEPLHELAAAGVRLDTDFDDGAADLQLCTWWQIVISEVQIDIELIASERPAGAVRRNQRDDTRIHHRQLCRTI